MKPMGALSVCLMGLLWAGMSLGADCTALPSDSIFRLECERSRKGLETPKDLQAQLMSAPASQQGQQARHRPWAEDAPPIRKPGAEPLITIFLVSGSTIRADKTWAKGDRLFYFSRGERGSVPLKEVNRLEDLRHKLRTGGGQ